MSNFNFTPCHDFCPAITGKPYGSVRYCPMQQNLRHRKLSLRMKNISPYLNAYPKGEHPFYDHPDYTDCCINFQCCAGEIESLGMKKFFEELTRRL